MPRVSPLRSAQNEDSFFVILLACSLLSLAACGAEHRTAPRVDDFRPMRIVSLDYCADQYVLQLVEPERILALSRDAQKEFSYLRDLAADLPTVRPAAEDVLVLGPDLVIRSYGGGPNAQAFYARAGVAVLNIGSANTIGEVMTVMAEVAAGLGESERGAEVIEETRRRLAALPAASRPETTLPEASPPETTSPASFPPATSRPPQTLYMTAGGATTGPGSLVHEMLLAAGLENYERTPGWQSIPLESLAFEAPELVAYASFGAGADNLDAWSAMRHPLAQSQLAGRSVVALDGAWTACGAWFLLDAVEALARSAAAQ